MGICQNHATLLDTKLMPYFDSNNSQSSQGSLKTSKNLTDIYELGEVIGEGSFGTVRKASSLLFPNMKVAVKSIPKSNLTSAISCFRTEIKVLSSIDHPNIIKLYDTFEDLNSIHIVVKLCSEGDLLTKIIKNGRIPEKQAAVYTAKLLRAISHVHYKKISHRDIKPQNILFDGPELKLIDFGLSKKFLKHKNRVNMKSFVGTPIFTAPEVLNLSYNEKCDEWGIGIILFLMLTGTYPFDGECSNDIYSSILKFDIHPDEYILKHLSADAVDLLQRLLQKDPVKRISASEALTHPWIRKQENFSFDEKLALQILSDWNCESIGGILVEVLVRFLKTDFFEEINSIFCVIDRNGKGCLDSEDFIKALDGLNVNKKDALSRFANLDKDNKGIISYSQFFISGLKALLKLDKVSEKDWSVFMRQTRPIVLNDFRSLFKNISRYSDEQVQVCLSLISEKGVILGSKVKIFLKKYLEEEELEKLQ